MAEVHAELRGVNWGRFLPGVLVMTPLCYPISVRLVGEMHGAELLAITLTPLVFLFCASRRLDRITLTVLGLGLLWLFGQVVSDTCNTSPIINYARGWSKIVFLLMIFYTYRSIFPAADRRCLALGLTLALGLLADVLLTPSTYARSEWIGDLWKFGYAYPTSILVFYLASSRPGHMRLYTALGLALSGLHLAMGSRSWALITAIATALLRPETSLSHDRWRHALRTVLIIMVFANFFSAMLSIDLGGKGALSNHAAQIEGAFGPLTGRGEVLVGFYAACHRPIIGYGSWPEDPYWSSYLHNLPGHTGAPPNSDAIPSHSHAVGAWVEAGILGGIFWAVVFVMLAKQLHLHYCGKLRLYPLQVFCCALLLWDILFSPFGYERRFMDAVLLVIVFAKTDCSNDKHSSISEGAVC